LRLRINFSRARCDAVYTGTVPLRQATAGRAAEDMDPNQPNLSSQFPVRSDRAGVTGAFKKDWHCFERRFDPPFFRYHESRSSIKSYAIWVNLFFDEGNASTKCESMSQAFKHSG